MGKSHQFVSFKFLPSDSTTRREQEEGGRGKGGGVQFTVPLHASRERSNFEDRHRQSGDALEGLGEKGASTDCSVTDTPQGNVQTLRTTIDALEGLGEKGASIDCSVTRLKGTFRLWGPPVGSRSGGFGFRV